MTVFIMAAGDSARCFNVPKQLLVLPDGQTLLGRLTNQIRGYGYDPVTVTHRDSIREQSWRASTPENRDTLCNSILSTNHLWSATNIFILGDVVLTRHGMQTIMQVDKEVAVYGNEAEIYAMRFDLTHTDAVEAALTHGAAYKLGKLRYFYKSYVGLPLGGPDMENNTLVWLRDATNDIDSLEEYENMLRAWSVAGNQPGYYHGED